MRRCIIAGNRKMHPCRVDEGLPSLRRIRFQLSEIEEVDGVLYPPFTVWRAIAGMYGEAIAQVVRMQYGGSVNEVDGALVGGASLKADFVELVRRAALAR